jgi:uncharacterized protein YjbK
MGVVLMSPDLTVPVIVIRTDQRTGEVCQEPVDTQQHQQSTEKPYQLDQTHSSTIKKSKLGRMGTLPTYQTEMAEVIGLLNVSSVRRVILEE